MNLPETATSARSILSTSPEKLRKTISYYLAFIGLGLTTASLGPTLPGLAEQTQSQLAEISFLFTARSFGYMVGAWIGGRFYDRMPGHPVLAGVLIAIAVALAVTPIVPLLWLLTTVLLVVGLAEGALDVGGNTLLVWVHDHRVGPFMNGLHFFYGVGAFLAPLIIAQVILRTGGIGGAYWIIALLLLPIALWLLRLPSPAAQTVSKDAPAAGQVNHLLVAMIVLFFFVYTGAEVGFGGWIYTYAVTRNIAPDMAAYLTSAYWGAFTVGRLVAIPLAVRFRPRSILLSDLLGGLVSLILILTWPDSTLATWLGTLGLGLSMASIFPTTLLVAERRMTVTGRVNGWFFGGASAGAMSLPWLIGQLFEPFGPQVVMWAILGDMILALLIFVVLISYSARAVVKPDQA